MYYCKGRAVFFHPRLSPKERCASDTESCLVGKISSRFVDRRARSTAQGPAFPATLSWEMNKKHLPPGGGDVFSHIESGGDRVRVIGSPSVSGVRTARLGAPQKARETLQKREPLRGGGGG